VAPPVTRTWRARTDLENDPRTSFFTPADLLYRRVRRRPLIIEEDYIFGQIAQGVRDIVRAGGRAGLGSHGQQDGIGAHWELWMLASGGMTAMEALRVATLFGAESIGFSQDLGSVEPGKLADLLVLDSNPLDDIHNSVDIRYVMKNGEIYDSMTLDRIWPTPRPFPRPFWAKEACGALNRRSGRRGTGVSYDPVFSTALTHSLLKKRNCRSYNGLNCRSGDLSAEIVGKSAARGSACSAWNKVAIRTPPASARRMLRRLGAALLSAQPERRERPGVCVLGSSFRWTGRVGSAAMSAPVCGAA